jgi:sugar phosphate isomerase/epimerase
VRYRDRHFFELGRGGVDFPAILQVLNEANWKGWFTLELDSTVTTAKGSATVSKQYIEQILKLAL